MPKKKTLIPADIVRNLDLPHKRVAGWKWIQEASGKKEFSRLRLEFYAEKLVALGMRKEDIQILLSDLYWDSYNECVGNDTFNNLP